MQTKQCRSAALKIASCVELNGEETADDDDDDDNGDKKTMKQNVNCSVSDLPSHWTRPHNSQVHTHTHTHVDTRAAAFLCYYSAALLLPMWPSG